MPQRHWCLAGVLIALFGLTANPAAQVPAAAPLTGWFVADASNNGIVVLLSQGGELYVPIREFDLAREHLTTRPGGLAPTIDMRPSLIPRLVGDRVHVGDPWTVDGSASGRLHAVVDHFVLGYKNCGEAWGVFLRLLPFETGRPPSVSTGGFVAHPGANFGLTGRRVGPLQRGLSEPERGELAMLVEQARRQTIGAVRHQWARDEPARLANPALRDWDARWTELDKSLDRQDARLWFEEKLYQLTPDGDPRVFVRARWTVHGFVAYSLTMWARLSGAHLTIESIDTAPALLVRSPAMEAVTIDRTTSEVLAVFDVNNDGRAEILLLRPGADSTDRDLVEYPAAAGAQPRVIAHYSDGC